MKRSTAPKTSPADDAGEVSRMPIIDSSSVPQERRRPVPMLASEIIRIETAMHFAQVSDKTIRRWSQADGIGRQAEKHAPLQVSFPALLMKLDGEAETLERLRSGQREDPAVRFYLDRAKALLEQERVRFRHSLVRQ